MKYILLDTNIILDMVVDRRHQVTDTLLANFIKLLEFDEIKLVVPEIVKIETYRHLDEELSLVGAQIKKAMNSIKGLYGIASYTIAGLDIKEYKKKSNAELAKAYDMYQQNEANYKVALTDTINLLFNHRNSIIIPFDEFLGNAVTKRRIYKKAPFHRVEKESYGDGLITETLINLGMYISLTSSDSIYFVTGNYTDFCVGKDAKTTLLPDIIQDIVVSGIPCPVKCINTFGELIGNELRDNVEAANLSQEFEKDLRERQEAELAQWASDLEDMDRETIGLIPMHGYSDMMEEHLAESSFSTEVVRIFDGIGKAIRGIEECDNALYEELTNIVDCATITELPAILGKFKNLFEQGLVSPSVDIGETNEFNVADLLRVRCWLKSQECYFDKITSMANLPDFIKYGEPVCIPKSTLENVTLQIGGLYLTPEEGSSEDIDITISANSTDIIAHGRISVTYGFIDFDEDGGASDGTADDVTYECSEIVEVLKGILDDWDSVYAQQKQISNFLRDTFSLT